MRTSREDPARLLSLAVHEFRTPLTVVAGYLRMLLKHYGDTIGEPQRKLLEEAEKSCGRLTGLVAELSDLAHLKDGRARLARQDIDLAALMAEVAEVVHEGRDRGVTVRVDAEPATVMVEGDARRMREALNAILTATLREHIEPGIIVAHTTVDRQAEGDPMALVVIGEPGTAAPSPASEAWGPFQDLRGGLGFRLVLAREVIEAAGGQVYSKRDGGVRAAVLVVLPLKETLG